MRKTINKLFYFTLSVVLILALIGGCGNKNKTEEEPPAPVEVTAEEPAEEPEEPVAAPVVDTGDLSSDPYSFEFMLEGIVYTLPVPFSEFADEGWVIEESFVASPDDTLDPDQYATTVPVENNGKELYFTFVNNDVNTKLMGECEVGGVDVEQSFVDRSGVQVVFPGGLTIGGSYDSVVDLYGEPSDIYDSETFPTCTYSVGSYSELKIGGDENGLVYSMGMRNLIKTEKATVATGDAPDIVKAYKAPTSLGDSWNSFTANYDGVMYTLPVPVSVFMENGWVPVSDENELMDAKDFQSGFEIRSGNQVLRTGIVNYDTSQQPAKFCFITYIEYYDNGANVSIELAKGITEKSSIDDIIKEYGEPNDKGDSSSFAFYTWGKVFEELSVSIDKETKKITKMALDYNPKSL